MVAKKSAKASTVSNDKTLDLLSNVQKMSANDLVRTINDVKLAMVSQFDSINATILEQLKTLSDVNVAIEIQKQNLKELQDIIAEGQTLEDILASQEKTRIGFAEEIAETRKTAQREESEYQYSLKIKRRAEEDEWNNKKTKREAELLARENTLKAMETDYNNWKLNYQNMPQEIEAKVKAEVATVSNAMKRNYENEKALAQKDADMALKLAQQTIESQTKRISELEIALADARKSTNEATQRVQTIAEKAIENAAKQAPVVITGNNNDQPARK
jgi:hypothetical protein